MLTCLQVHNDYLIQGGETKSTKLIAKALEDNGIRVIRYYRSNDELKTAGLREKVSIGVQSIYNKNTIKEIEEILNTNHVDFALIHNVSPVISNSIYAVLLKHKIPIYKYLQNYNILCLNGAMDMGDYCARCQKNSLIGVRNSCYKNSKIYSLQKYITKKLLWSRYLENISGFFAISDFVKRIHVCAGIPDEKIHVLYHFCEHEPSLLADKERFISADRYIVYMGRLSREKGIMTLVKAVRELPKVRLKIMGSGDCEAEIREFIESKDIDNIEMLGYKSGEEKDYIVGNAIALVAPSEWEEPFGRIVIEAYEVGTPVIASAVGGLKELVKENVTGYIFQQSDVEGLKNRIEKMYALSDSDLYAMRMECIQAVKDNYSTASYIHKFLDVIEEAAP
ncbi:MAG: glycosyltransferase family 4 protein [Oscillospiraceae bacterium]|nr:glycosyltransferase family 4 protein [Oscillospiraceae bacterium]